MLVHTHEAMVFGFQTLFVNQRSWMSIDASTGYKPTPLWIF